MSNELLLLSSVLTNPLIDSYTYRGSHFKQYPPDTDYQQVCIESGDGLFPTTVFFGLQMILKRAFSRPLTYLDVEQANAFYTAHGESFPYDEFIHVVMDLGGKIPLHIRAMPEGSVVPTGIPLVTVETTDPKFAAIGTFFETQLLRVCALLQQLNRDTQRFEMPRDVFNPAKKSKAGRLDVIVEDGKYKVVTLDGPAHRWDSVMRTVFFNGIVTADAIVRDVRE